jgi:two-component SAPR family response regulator
VCRSWSARPEIVQRGHVGLDCRGARFWSEPGVRVALWRGELLEGSDYTWADQHIYRLRATLFGLLECAGHARLERGDACGVLQMAEQVIASTNSMSNHGASRCEPNTPSGCESITRGYEDLAHTLDQDLGLQSTRETRLLYRQLLGQS